MVDGYLNLISKSLVRLHPGTLVNIKHRPQTAGAFGRMNAALQLKCDVNLFASVSFNAHVSAPYAKELRNPVKEIQPYSRPFLLAQVRKSYRCRAFPTRNQSRRHCACLLPTQIRQLRIHLLQMLILCDHRCKMAGL